MQDSEFKMQIGPKCGWLPRAVLCLHFAFCILHYPAPATAQQLLDRIVARIGTSSITMSDVNAAMQLGIVEGSEFDLAAEQLIQRQLILAEVARFAPPDPDPAAVDKQLEAMRMRVGARLPELLQSTGVDDTRMREMARDTLRIQSYLNQRFGTTVQVSDEEVAQYYRAFPAEFTRNGVLMPFAEAEPLARMRASATRRAAIIAQWLTDLRARAQVTVPAPRT